MFCMHVSVNLIGAWYETFYIQLSLERTRGISITVRFNEVQATISVRFDKVSTLKRCPLFGKVDEKSKLNSF